MMPWVRIDEHAMNHPKIAGLTDGSFRLWVQALAHCQNLLTDGLVQPVALRALRAYTKKRRAELVTVGLWNEAGADSIQVHDYLQWNDSRADVLEARDRGRERRKRWRESHASPDASLDAGRTVTSPVRGTYSLSPVVASEGEGDSKGETARAWGPGAFSEWYGETHERILGVAYIGNPQSDYQTCLRLTGTFSERDLRDAVLVWFGMNDDFATRGTRTIPKFASRATHCVQLARKATA